MFVLVFQLLVFYLVLVLVLVIFINETSFSLACQKQVLNFILHLRSFSLSFSWVL